MRGGDEGACLITSMDTKSSLMPRSAGLDCCCDDTEDRSIRTIRCLLLRIMAAITRSQYLRVIAGQVKARQWKASGTGAAPEIGGASQSTRGCMPALAVQLPRPVHGHCPAPSVNINTLEYLTCLPQTWDPSCGREVHWSPRCCRTRWVGCVTC